MKDVEIIDLTPKNIAEYGVCGYKNIEKHPELRKKIEWFKKYYPKGLRIKILFSKSDGNQGMIEYIPGEYAHRPVDTGGYMFIHCIFIGPKKEFKGKGHASSLIEECIKDAKKGKMQGVAVVTRKGAFMAKKDIFLKKGFVVVDEAKPDFELLVLKFDQSAADPQFKNMEESLKNYEKGLFIFRSVQCPYAEKNVNSIIKTAQNKFKIKADLIDLQDAKAVQQVPCAFGIFCIIYNGEIISHHPINNTRFENIMKKRMK